MRPPGLDILRGLRSETGSQPEYDITLRRGRKGASFGRRAVITVTESARRVLKAILIASEADPDEGLRLLPGPDGRFVLELDAELHGDLVIEHEGYKVLLIGIEYLRMLDGKTVDCQATQAGAILFVR